MSGKPKRMPKFKRKRNRPGSSHTAVGQAPSAALSIGQAAALLGVSPPTIRRMVSEGELKHFRTPGGHVRILPHSLRQLGNGNVDSSTGDSTRDELQRLRRERELINERREIERLKAERAAEDRARREQDQIRLAEAQAARAESDRIKLEKETARTQERARRRLEDFRFRWLNQGIAMVAGLVSDEEKQKVREALVAELSSHQPFEESAMHKVVVDTICKTMGPGFAETWLLTRVLCGS
jgi:excisionase family DNA binding protein